MFYKKVLIEETSKRSNFILIFLKNENITDSTESLKLSFASTVLVGKTKNLHSINNQMEQESRNFEKLKCHHQQVII